MHWSKNVATFEVWSISLVRVDNKKKDILVLGKGSTHGLNDTTITAKAEYFINFLRSAKNFAKVWMIMETTVFAIKIY